MNAPVVKIDGFEMVPENDEEALLKAVANQPVSVAIDASGGDMQFYSEVNFYFTDKIQIAILKRTYVSTNKSKKSKLFHKKVKKQIEKYKSLYFTKYYREFTQDHVGQSSIME